MKKRPTMLSATFVRNVNVPGRYGGLGPTPMVKPATRRGCCKSWGQCIRINGFKTTIGLGAAAFDTLCAIVLQSRPLLPSVHPRATSTLLTSPTGWNGSASPLKSQCVQFSVATKECRGDTRMDGHKYMILSYFFSNLTIGSFPDAFRSHIETGLLLA